MDPEQCVLSELLSKLDRPDQERFRLLNNLLENRTSAQSLEFYQLHPDLLKWVRTLPVVLRSELDDPEFWGPHDSPIQIEDFRVYPAIGIEAFRVYPKRRGPYKNVEKRALDMFWDWQTGRVDDKRELATTYSPSPDSPLTERTVNRQLKRVAEALGVPLRKAPRRHAP